MELKQHVVDERTGSGYTLHGDYYLQDLILPEHESFDLGMYASAKHRYLQNCRKGLLCSMQLEGTLNKYLHEERIRHILQKQVYGMAPTRIIYLIATNYILGFDEELKNANHHFVQADAAEAAKNGTLQKLVDKSFGNAAG